jgi:hypothetical protein
MTLYFRRSDQSRTRGLHQTRAAFWFFIVNGSRLPPAGELLRSLMAIPKLRERSLSELSKISVRYLLGPSSKKPYLEILVIKYVGCYPVGSAGNDDAQYMYAMAKAAVAAFEPWGVIHDLSELVYEWGDRVDMFFGVGPYESLGESESLVGNLFRQSNSSRAAQPAIVVGPACAEAVRTLLVGEESAQPLEKVGNVFHQFADAWAFVDAQIE